MKQTDSSTQVYFNILHNNKTYFVDYLTSTGPIGNREPWQVTEEFEEIPEKVLILLQYPFIIIITT